VTAGVDVSAAAVVQTYTVPAATASRLTWAAMLMTAGAAPTITLVKTVAAAPTVIATKTATFAGPFALWAQATDTITWEVTVGGVAGVATLTLITDEYGV